MLSYNLKYLKYTKVFNCGFFQVFKFNIGVFRLGGIFH